MPRRVFFTGRKPFAGPTYSLPQKTVAVTVLRSIVLVVGYFVSSAEKHRKLEIESKSTFCVNSPYTYSASKNLVTLKRSESAATGPRYLLNFAEIY